MENKLNQQLIRQLRAERAWSQVQLAEMTGLSLRTIQRIEKHGQASLESSKSLAAVFELNVQQLTSADPSRQTLIALACLAVLLLGGLLISLPVAADLVMLNVVVQRQQQQLADVHLLNEAGTASELWVGDQLRLTLHAEPVNPDQFRIKARIQQTGAEQAEWLAEPEIITTRQQPAEIHFADYQLTITAD
jgi:DNA-binding XRE family transcriptional regulator